MYHENSLDTLCAALAYAMGIEKPNSANDANEALCRYVDEVFHSEKADRIFMYNPDAIADWVYRKYPQLCEEGKRHGEIEIPLCSVMPSVTPVCFATMYTGTQPDVHGIKQYEKPVVRTDSIFDALIRAGKRAAIIGDNHCSLGKIFLEKDMDYFLYDTLEEIHAKAIELLMEDKHDLIVVYNATYDSLMHRYGTESVEALAELRSNFEAFGMFSKLIEQHWSAHNTLVGFAMDHGCHDMDQGFGAHGLSMEEDLNITHLYKAYPKKK